MPNAAEHDGRSNRAVGGLSRVSLHPPCVNGLGRQVAAEQRRLDRLWPHAEAGGDSAAVCSLKIPARVPGCAGGWVGGQTGGAGGRGDNIERILSNTHKEIDSKGAKEPDTPPQVHNT